MRTFEGAIDVVVGARMPRDRRRRRERPTTTNDDLTHAGLGFIVLNITFKVYASHAGDIDFYRVKRRRRARRGRPM